MQNHYWIIERYIGGLWEPIFTAATRSLARAKAQSKYPTRIRKFIAA